MDLRWLINAIRIYRNCCEEQDCIQILKKGFRTQILDGIIVLNTCFVSIFTSRRSVHLYSQNRELTITSRLCCFELFSFFVFFEQNDYAKFDLSSCMHPSRVRLETFEIGIKKIQKSCNLNILKFKVFSYVFRSLQFVNFKVLSSTILQKNRS